MVKVVKDHFCLYFLNKNLFEYFKDTLEEELYSAAGKNLIYLPKNFGKFVNYLTQDLLKMVVFDHF